MAASNATGALPVSQFRAFGTKPRIIGGTGDGGGPCRTPNVHYSPGGVGCLTKRGEKGGGSHEGAQ